MSCIAMGRYVRVIGKSSLYFRLVARSAFVYCPMHKRSARLPKSPHVVVRLDYNQGAFVVADFSPTPMAYRIYANNTRLLLLSYILTRSLYNYFIFFFLFPYAAFHVFSRFFNDFFFKSPVFLAIFPFIFHAILLSLIF